MSQQLGKTIRIIRQAKNLRLQALAGKSGISVPFLSLLEAGQRQPSVDVIRRIAQALAIPSEALILAAVGPATDLSSSDATVASITQAIHNLMHTEDQLRQLLGTRGPVHETNRSSAKGCR